MNDEDKAYILLVAGVVGPLVSNLISAALVLYILSGVKKALSKRDQE